MAELAKVIRLPKLKQKMFYTKDVKRDILRQLEIKQDNLQERFSQSIINNLFSKLNQIATQKGACRRFPISTSQNSQYDGRSLYQRDSVAVYPAFKKAYKYFKYLGFKVKLDKRKRSDAKKSSVSYWYHELTIEGIEK